jgi:DNA topoisomerase I
MPVSKAKISKADDQALDASASKARPVPPGLSIRNGPVGDDDSMDVDTTTNGTKRKSRSSIGTTVNYKDDSDSDGDAPLVC